MVAAAGLVVATRLRRRDPRTPWLLAVGGAFVTTGMAFSFAGGIFHPYYVSLLAPFVAALVGAGVGQMAGGGRRGRVIGPLAVAAGAITELVVLNELNGSLGWAVPLVAVVSAATAVLLMMRLSPRVRLAVAGVALAALLAAPATWAAETLGHAENGTIPTGGAAGARGGSGGFGRPRGFAQGPRGFGSQGAFRGPPGPNAGPPPGFAPSGGPRGFAGGAPAGGMFAGDSSSLTAAVRYARTHGGGTVGLESQSSAASLILSSNANVAGLGGFSGRESSVRVSWLASEVRSGHVRWILAGSEAGPRLGGDTRTGSQSAFSAVSKACRRVTLASATMYDCQGRASAIMAAAAK